MTCRKDYRWIRVQNQLVLDTLQDQVLQYEGDWELCLVGQYQVDEGIE